MLIGGTADRLDGHFLRRWLTEVEGWKEEVAARLVDEFEFGMGLLRKGAGKRW